MSLRPKRHASLELLDELGSLGPRADDGHLPTKDVQQLGQLVETEKAHEPTAWNHAWVVLPRPLGDAGRLGVTAHGSKLQDREEFAVLPKAPAGGREAIRVFV